MRHHSAEDRQQCLDFLLSACRTWLLHTRQIRSGSSSDRTNSHIDFSLSAPPNLNPETLKQISYFQGIEPIVYDLIRRRILLQDNLPPNLLTGWERTYFNTFIQNTRFIELLTQVLAKTGEENIPSIALKGLASSAMLYKDVGLRPMADIDILCHTKDLKALSDILYSLGFSRKGLLQAHHIGFTHQDLGILVELHFALQYIVKKKKAILTRFWMRLHSAQIDEARFPILSIEDQLLFEMGHILDHVYCVSLKHFQDFAGWLTLLSSEIDWDYLTSILTKSGMLPEFLSLSRILSELLQMPIKIPIQSEVSSNKFDDVKNIILSSLAGTGFIKAPQAGIRIKSYATLTQKLGFTLSKLFPPRPVIQATYNISSPLSSLFSYPYHISKTLLDFQSRKKRDDV
jgi:hypothetical protein